MCKTLKINELVAIGTLHTWHFDFATCMQICEVCGHSDTIKSQGQPEDYEGLNSLVGICYLKVEGRDLSGS